MDQLFLLNGPQSAAYKRTKPIPSKPGNHQNLFPTPDSPTVRTFTYPLTKIISALFNSSIPHSPRYLDQHGGVLQRFEIGPRLGYDFQGNHQRCNSPPINDNHALCKHDDIHAIQAWVVGSGTSTDAVGLGRSEPSAICPNEVEYRETTENSELPHSSMETPKLLRSSPRNTSSKRTPQYYSKLAGASSRKRNQLPQNSNPGPPGKANLGKHQMGKEKGQLGSLECDKK